MSMFTSASYRDFVPKVRRLAAPVKLRHSWVPLMLLLVAVYRNQSIADLSLAELALGLGIAVLSMLPLFIWASQDDRELPGFQCFCAIHFPYFAYPILTSKPEYMQYPESDRLLTAATVFVFLAILNLVYYALPARQRHRGPSRILEARGIPEEHVPTLFGLLLFGWSFFTVANIFGMVRLGATRNIIVSCATGAGLVGLWVLAQRYGEGRLTGPQKFVFWLSLGTGLTVSIATTSLIAALVTIVVGCVAFTLGRRQIPWVLVISALGMISFFNLAKGDVRLVMWRTGYQPVLSVGSVIETYETWIPLSWQYMLYGNPHTERAGILDRASLVQVQARVVSETPRNLNYLYGETYELIPQLLVPRIFWKEKPHSHTASQLITRRYGLQSGESFKTTTIAVGVLAESWVNFGWFGVVMLACVVGAAMRFVANACKGASIYSLHSLLGIVWISLCFQIELPTSAWISTLLQTALALFVIVYPFTRSHADMKLSTSASYSPW